MGSRPSVARTPRMEIYSLVLRKVCTNLMPDSEPLSFYYYVYISIFYSTAFAFVCFIDRSIRIYDTSKGRFKEFKRILARDVGWSVLDTAFSPDGRHVAYSSWSEASE
jgi:hypothetical protein